MEQAQQHMSFKCLKCGNSQCEVGEMYSSGSKLSKIFNVHSNKYKTATCTQCGFTEFYKKPKAGTWENIFDFLVN